MCIRDSIGYVDSVKQKNAKENQRMTRDEKEKMEQKIHTEAPSLS